MSAVAGFTLWFGDEPRNLAVLVAVDASFASVSEIYVEATFAMDQDSGHDVIEVWSSAISSSCRKLRVARHYSGLPGRQPRLEVKVTAGESRYAVTVQAATGPQGLQLSPFGSSNPSMTQGLSGDTLIIERVKEQKTA